MPNPASSLDTETLVRDIPEKRMVMRLLDYWKVLRGENAFPTLQDFNLEVVPDFGPHAFVLDFTEGFEHPVFRFAGRVLADHCGHDLSRKPLTSVPPGSLLSKMTDHYRDIILKKEPLRFEGRHEDDDGAIFDYRGIMLPFGEDGETIDCIVGALNWRKKSSQTTSQKPADDAARLGGLEAEIDEIVDQGRTDRLTESLSACRMLAREFDDAHSRSRKALYRALEAAYKFYFETEADTQAYAELLAKAGLTRQERAPFTPVLKLIFGVDYDKTRLSEYAAALSFALRNGQTVASFSAFVQMQDGGIKGCVKAERAVRHAQDGKTSDWGEQARQILRRADVIGQVSDTGSGESEFVLMLGRRSTAVGGAVQVLAVVEEKPSVVDSILQRAAKRIAKKRREKRSAD